jgi:ankyrin repeat protein
MQLLLMPKYGANVNHADTLGRCPLHLAAAAGNVNVMALLLRTPGCQVDPQSLGGETPLMRAVQYSRVHAVRLLLQAGANAFGPRNLSGLNALDYARITRNNEVETYLLNSLP